MKILFVKNVYLAGFFSLISFFLNASFLEEGLKERFIKTLIVVDQKTKAFFSRIPVLKRMPDRQRRVVTALFVASFIGGVVLTKRVMNTLSGLREIEEIIKRDYETDYPGITEWFNKIPFMAKFNQIFVLGKNKILTGAVLRYSISYTFANASKNLFR